MRPEVIRTRRGADEVNLKSWRVFIEELEVLAAIGVHPHEHDTHQRILIDVDLDMTGAKTPREDRLAETLDYEAVSKAVVDMAREGHVQLVETLAERIARWCMKDARVACARVRVIKPEALTNARGSGCEVVLGRE
jgi:dihydroneopterin aldolase